MRPIDADALAYHYCPIAPVLKGDKEAWRFILFDSDIDHAPTIDPVPRWIPCEERLPENESAVLVTDANGHIRHAFYDAECDWFGTYEESMTIRAIAWMPLPEPYGAESNERMIIPKDGMEIQGSTPTVDAVPVVRCKDCKWKADTIGESWCDFHEFTILSDDDYCYHGERRRR